MRSLVTALGVFVVGSALAQTAPTPADTQVTAEVRALTDRFIDAWNKHDVKALAAMWTPDGDHSEPDGRTVHGTAEIEKLFTLEHGTVFKNSELNLVVERVRSISDTVAVADGTYELFKATDPAGRPIGIRTGYFVNVVVKEGGDWKVSASRLMLPATLIWRER
jgi:uncharacterized protein (TIGR02246 family)